MSFLKSPHSSKRKESSLPTPKPNLHTETKPYFTSKSLQKRLKPFSQSNITSTSIHVGINEKVFKSEKVFTFFKLEKVIVLFILPI